ncbi:hypothetical protein EYF80_015831 [Liparis tanakae]|uniref:Uncharacterized protein n=1 Tax=Liparis tanakae TaxID=230148 RepID=A0A4Z2I826_9TELE|nr:hypothetical protein EYF80_015831 [Liparis tanakae]
MREEGRDEEVDESEEDDEFLEELAQHLKAGSGSLRGIHTSSYSCLQHMASFMIGSPFVTSSGVAMNNIRSLTGGFVSSGAGLQSPSHDQLLYTAQSFADTAVVFIGVCERKRRETMRHNFLSTVPLQESASRSFVSHSNSPISWVSIISVPYG